MTDTLHFLRHAHTTHNGPPKRFQGRLDVELSDKGVNQCIKAQNSFNWVKRVVASPAIRVQQTLEHLFNGSDNEPTIEFDEDLWEIDNGWFSGKLESEVKEIDSKSYDQWMKTPAEANPGGGESLCDLLDRGRSAIRRIHARYPCEGTLVATHGGIIRVLSLHASMRSLNLFHSIEVSNLELTKLEIKELLRK